MRKRISGWWHSGDHLSKLMAEAESEAAIRNALQKPEMTFDEWMVLGFLALLAAMMLSYPVQLLLPWLWDFLVGS